MPRWTCWVSVTGGDYAQSHFETVEAEDRVGAECIARRSGERRYHREIAEGWTLSVAVTGSPLLTLADS